MREASEAGLRWRPGLASLAACLGLCACEGPRALDPAAIWREVSGANDAARPAPPGLDRPFPSLHSVPPRPDRPSPESREAITAALAADRDRSREPVALRAAPGEAGAPPAPPAGLSAGPPPRPALAAAPRVPWTEAQPAGPPARGGEAPAAVPSAPATRAATPRPAAPAAAVPEVPDAAPAPPPPDLLGAPPPPPPSELLAPPPPARR